LADVDALVARCLAKSPRQRFASMQELAAALARVDRRRPPTSGVRDKTGQVVMPRARVGVGWALALGVVAALAGGGGVWLGTRHAGGGATLLVTSQPGGASVEVDGQPWRETTPTAVTALAAGRHEVKLRRAGHGGGDEVVTLLPNSRGAIDVVLTPAERELEVQTLPAGALVFVDGHLAHGRTPLPVSLSEDDFHELRIELDGYEPETRALKPEDHEPTLMVHLAPEKQDRGTIWVDGPATAQVYVDGAPTGSWAPTVGLQVTAGPHSVELHDDAGALLMQKSVTIKRGTSLHVTLDPRLRAAGD
jgi:hypothetical protein